MEVIDNVVVGKPDIEPSKPSHVAGVRRGNQPPKIPHRGLPREDAKRSTGINPDEHEPIDPKMPHLSPA